MGRIAEALKRAQEERARRADDPHAARSSESGGRFQQALRRGRARGQDQPDDVLGSTIDAPPRSEPLATVADPILPEMVPPQVVTFHDPTSQIAEKYRSVRTRLLTGNPTGSARALAITSSLAGEGKTVTVGNLGFSLGELRHLRVCAIDLDVRRRGLSKLFGVQDRPGMAELLRGEKKLSEVCMPVVRENLFMVPAGDPQSANPSELISSGYAQRIFRELNERFHYTLVDTPPINTAADIGLIAPMCHAVVLVIRMHKTPEPVLQRCVKLLQANHLTIAGCILAGCDDQVAGYSETQDYYDSGA